MTSNSKSNGDDDVESECVNDYYPFAGLPPPCPQYRLPYRFSPLPTFTHPTPTARTISEFNRLRHDAIISHPYDQFNKEAMSSFRPHPTDVFLAPFGKCGTTYLQQIFHQLRLPGDEAFGEITYATPWVDRSVYMNVDINEAQRAHPRGFKTHLPYESLPPSCRYIIAFRHPKDQLVSMYHFMSHWYLDPSYISISEYAEEWMSDAKYLSYAVSWLSQLSNPAVLTLTYEFMVDHQEVAIALIANHCGITLNRSLLETVKKHSSFEYMSAHKSLFGDYPMKLWGHLAVGLAMADEKNEVGKVRKGKVGENRKELDEGIAKRIDNMWNEMVGKKFGFESYESLEMKLREGLISKGKELLKKVNE